MSNSKTMLGKLKKGRDDGPHPGIHPLVRTRGGLYLSRNPEDVVRQAGHDSRFLVPKALVADATGSLQAMDALLRAVRLMRGRRVFMQPHDLDEARGRVGRAHALVHGLARGGAIESATTAARRFRLRQRWRQRVGSRITLKDGSWRVPPDQRPPCWQHFRLRSPLAGLKKA